MSTHDVVIAGGGVLGTVIARSLLRAQPDLRVALLEKEPALAIHQSGRNSGVVHVGYNQKPGSLKARFVVEGSRRLRAFCREHGVGMIEDGILVVATRPEELATLAMLHAQGQANGARVELVDAEAVRRLEPSALGIAGLWAPEGASFDAPAYVFALAAEARAAGAEFALGEPVLGLTEGPDHVAVRTPCRTLKARSFVNAAGLHADRLALQLGLSTDYRIVPFRGAYFDLSPDKRHLVRAHIYPCPDMRFPFLGVHLSRTFDGRVQIGPSAILALGREAYGPPSFHGQDVAEMLRFGGFWRMMQNPVFQQQARQEWRRGLFKGAALADIRRLVPGVTLADLGRGRAGIRAQLVSRDGRLVDDLVVEETARSVHVLNAVSPALTCSLPFGDHVAEKVLTQLERARRAP